PAAYGGVAGDGDGTFPLGSRPTQGAHCGRPRSQAGAALTTATLLMAPGLDLSHAFLIAQLLFQNSAAAMQPKQPFPVSNPTAQRLAGSSILQDRTTPQLPGIVAASPAPLNGAPQAVRHLSNPRGHPI